MKKEQAGKGTTYLLYKSGGETYEAEIILVENNYDTVTIACDFESVEQEIAIEIDGWDQVLQRPELTILALCPVEDELRKFVEVATYVVIIRVVEPEIEAVYSEVNVMDFQTYNEYKRLNKEG